MSRKKHYETLGVDESATQDEIKRAFRKKAGRHHPDKKGGQHDDMAEVNAAYLVLKSPERRARYDATGEDGAGAIKTEEQKIQDLVLRAFMANLLSDAPPLRSARTALEEQLKAHRANKAEATRARKKLLEKRSKVRSTAETNAYHLVIDQQVSAIDAALINMNAEVELFEKALAHLDKHYQSNVPEFQDESADFEPTITAYRIEYRG